MSREEALAQVAAARAARAAGDRAGAMAGYSAAAASSRAIGAADLLAHALRHLGDLQQESGDAVAASATLGQALAQYRALGADHALDLANTLRSLALARGQLDDRVQARALWTEARGLYAAGGVDAGVAECDRWLGDGGRGDGVLVDANAGPAVIYHNPACSTSRKTLALMRRAGIEPRVVDYLQSPPSRAELLALVRDAGIPLREAVREKDLGTLGLPALAPDAGDDLLLDLLAAQPRLLQRPFVRTSRGVRLARPLERVLEILPPVPPASTRDGEGQ